MGRIELQRGNIPQSIEYFKKAISLLPYHYSNFGISHSMFSDFLASAYYRAGDLDNALHEYSSIISSATGRSDNPDICAKSLYMLGKIYEQQGQKAKALEYYQKFLDLWKDADPGLPEVEDARQRLSKAP
jgi:tetratricopeptide (TPR) repeat protein